MTNFDEHRARSGYIAFGVAIMAVGVLFLLDRLDLIHRNALNVYWPGLLVAFGLARIVWPPRPGAVVGGMWIALVGGMLLLDRLSIAPMEQSWPVFVIVAGLTVVFKALGWLPSRPHWRDGRRWNEVGR